MSDPIYITLTKKVFNVIRVGRGERGYGVEIDISEAGILQWRQLYPDAPWNNIIAMSSLKGDTGDPGADAHIHIKWHAEGSEVLLSTPDAYIGIYADNTVADSAAYADYQWFKWKGDKGTPAPNTIWQYSVDGTTWTTDATGALYERQSGDNGATWSEAHEYPGVAALASKADKAAIQIANRVYDGVDLTVKYAAEIAGYSDVWAWIKARITAVNYDGLNIGDYIPFLLGGTETIWAQIAGIDTYYRIGVTPVGHHIDFISKDCMTTAYKWSISSNNNGDATNAAPWMISTLKSSLDALVTSLPAGLQAQIIEKMALTETRYTSGSTLLDSIGNSWNEIGKLWIPSEYEVCGSIIWGTKPRAAGNAIQYPIFANSHKNRLKCTGQNNVVTNWWLLTAASGSSTNCCSMNAYGFPSIANISTFYRAPLCFRIG